MYPYHWSDFIMAARVFHSANISELAEAMDFEDKRAEARADEEEPLKEAS